MDFANEWQNPDMDFATQWQNPLGSTLDFATEWQYIKVNVKHISKQLNIIQRTHATDLPTQPSLILPLSGKIQGRPLDILPLSGKINVQPRILPRSGKIQGPGQGF